MTTDFHCHLLPGIDDGARTLDDALAMARILFAAGYRTVCCTPHHIRGAWDLPAAKVRQYAAGLQSELQRAGIDLQLLPGREYYLDEFLLLELDDPLPLPGGLLLVELPGRCDPDQVRDTIFQLVRRKFIPMIAHPERSPLLSPPLNRRKGLVGRLLSRSESRVTSHQSPLLTYLQDLGCAFQGNLGSFAGSYGEQVRDNARRLLQDGVYTHLGSDGHTPGHLAETVSSGLNEVTRLAGPEALQRLLGQNNVNPETRA